MRKGMVNRIPAWFSLVSLKLNLVFEIILFTIGSPYLRQAHMMVFFVFLEEICASALRLFLMDKEKIGPGWMFPCTACFRSPCSRETSFKQRGN